MTRYLLNTNIISDALKPQPTAAIGRWVESQVGTDLFIVELVNPLRATS